VLVPLKPRGAVVVHSTLAEEPSSAILTIVHCIGEARRAVVSLAEIRTTSSHLELWSIGTLPTQRTTVLLVETVRFMVAYVLNG